MTRTDTNVIITEYRAEFRAEPFCRPRWTITSGMEYRTTLQRRRRHTVARDFNRVTLTEPAVRQIHPSNLLDSDAVVLFIPDNNTTSSRYGVAVVLEQVAR